MSGISNHNQDAFHFSYVELDNLLNRDVKDVHGILSNYVNNIKQLSRVQRDCLKSKLKQITSNRKIKDPLIRKTSELGLNKLQIVIDPLDPTIGKDQFNNRIEGWNLKANIFDICVNCTNHVKIFNSEIEPFLNQTDDQELDDFLIEKAIANGRFDTVKSLLEHSFFREEVYLQLLILFAQKNDIDSYLFVLEQMGLASLKTDINLESILKKSGKFHKIPEKAVKIIMKNPAIFKKIEIFPRILNALIQVGEKVNFSNLSDFTLKFEEEDFFFLAELGVWSQEDLQKRKKVMEKENRDQIEIDRLFEPFIDKISMNAKDLIVRVRKKRESSSVKRDIKESIETVEIHCSRNMLHKSKFLKEALKPEISKSSSKSVIMLEESESLIDLSDATQLTADAFQKVVDFIQGKKSVIHKVNTSDNDDAIEDFRKAVLFLDIDELNAGENCRYVSSRI